MQLLTAAFDTTSDTTYDAASAASVSIAASVTQVLSTVSVAASVTQVLSLHR